MRLSTDIDIIVRPGTDVDRYIEEAAKIFPFISCEEQKRVGKKLKRDILSLFMIRLSTIEIFIFYLIYCLKSRDMRKLLRSP